MISAGRDIRNLDVQIQNVSANDASVISAGRDIVFEANRNRNTGQYESGDEGIMVMGPGSLAVAAGRNIDLATSDGITSIGDLANEALPSNGADVTVLAGVGQGADYEDFALQYINNLQEVLLQPVTTRFTFTRSNGRYNESAVNGLIEALQSASGLAVDETSVELADNNLVLNVTVTDTSAARQLIAIASGQGATVGDDGFVYLGLYQTAVGNLLVRQRDMALTETEISRIFDTASSSFDALPLRQRQSLIHAVFFNVLRTTGVEAVESGSNNYDPAYAAIDTLFPGNAEAVGNLSMLQSRIHTQDNGNINILIPGGGANVGVASLANSNKAEDELGVLVEQFGSVNAYVRDDFQVNASRVFALRGGNITLFSRDGDIDAGRGAKSALSSPPPRLEERFDVNPDGTVTSFFEIVFPPTIAGSGIRNFAPPGSLAGDVFLFAPNGIIDAGDAGIGTAGNFFAGAEQLLGADNVNVGGVAVGIPTDTGGLNFSISGTEVATGAQRSAGEQGQTLDNKDAVKDNELALLLVEVLGYGEDEECDPKKDKDCSK